MSNEIIEHRTTTSMMLDSRAIESYRDMAKMMAQASVQVPDHLKGKPADCMAVVMQAAQWRMNPFVVAQKTHFINGNIGYEAQLINAVVSSSNAIEGRFHYEFQGTKDEWKPRWKKQSRNGKEFWLPEWSANVCARVGARLKGESVITWGEWTYPCDQTIFNSPLWRTNPKQQTGYLAVKFWARFYTPDVLLGAYTPDELHEMDMKDINPPPVEKPKTGSVLEKLQSVGEPEKTISKDISDALIKSEAVVMEWVAAIESCDNVKVLPKMRSDIAETDRLIDEQKSRLCAFIDRRIKTLTEEANDE